MRRSFLRNFQSICKGIVPEGLFQNEIVYDFTLQLQYSTEISDDKTWLMSWVKGLVSKF